MTPINRGSEGGNLFAHQVTVSIRLKLFLQKKYPGQYPVEIGVQTEIESLTHAPSGRVGRGMLMLFEIGDSENTFDHIRISYSNLNVSFNSEATSRE